MIFRILKVVKRTAKTGVISFCVLNTMISFVGYPAYITGKSMQVNNMIAFLVYPAYITGKSMQVHTMISFLVYPAYITEKSMEVHTVISFLVYPAYNTGKSMQVHAVISFLGYPAYITGKSMQVNTMISFLVYPAYITGKSKQVNTMISFLGYPAYITGKSIAGKQYDCLSCVSCIHFREIHAGTHCDFLSWVFSAYITGKSMHVNTMISFVGYPAYITGLPTKDEISETTVRNLFLTFDSLQL